MNEPEIPSPKMPSPIVVQKPNWVLKIFGGLVRRTIDSVEALPDLKKPHFSGGGSTNPLVLVVDAWAYVYRLFEYSTEPLKKGYVAWLKLALSIALYLLVPIAAIMGCVYIVLIMIAGVIGAANDMVCKALLLCLSVLALILLSYLVYVVICALLGIPIKVPVPKFKVKH